MRWLFLGAVAFAGSLALPAHARDIYGCERTSHPKIQTTHENRQEIWVAKAVQDGEQWRVIIDDSSRYAYLSDQTIQWLVFRECFFAGEPVPDDRRQDLYLAENADCWAARELRSGLGYSDRELKIIEYDLEVLNKEASETVVVLLGPLRSPYLFKCL